MISPTRSERGKRNKRSAWKRDGLRAGAMTALHIPIIVLIVWVLPSQKFGYPLVLLPLLLAGPLAVREHALARAAGAALVAGIVSGLIAAASVAVGSQVLGTSVWSLNSPAAAPPMPPLPRIMLLPTRIMTWAQQDMLFFQPVLALLLGLLAAGGWRLGRGLGRHAARVLPRSLSARLTLAFGGLTALTFAVGWVGFSALEEMHYRGHRLQLQVEWQSDLSEARQALDAEVLARTNGEAGVAQADAVDATYRELGEGSFYPGISLGPADVRAVLARYQPALTEAMAAHAAYRARPGDPEVLNRARAALSALSEQVDNEATSLLATDDLAHHQRLITVMLVVGLAGLLGIGLSQRTVAAIDAPIRRLGLHLQRVARGDFFQRVAVDGPDEIRRLAGAVNDMTVDLNRLYAAERAGRAAAEATATREHELAAAKEFWANTVVHDLKGPLSIVAGVAELLEAGRLGTLAASQIEAVADLRRATNDLMGLVSDINDSFRLEAAALPLNRQPVSPADLLRATAEECAVPGHPAPSIYLPQPVPPALADQRLIRRVLHNLVGNAYKHAGSSAEVTLGAGADRGYVYFVVRDNGPGIPLQDCERVFERFVQRDSAGPGSGLGLAFCKLVVEQHGGRIWAEAAPSGGTRLCFALPVAPIHFQVADHEPTLAGPVALTPAAA